MPSGMAFRPAWRGDGAAKTAQNVFKIVGIVMRVEVATRLASTSLP